MITEGKEFLKKIKGDVLILGIILALAFLTWLIPHITEDDTSGSEVVVLRDGNEIGRYSLSADNIITSGGTVKVTDADCPDQLCVRQRSISKNGESIICLPHKLVITIDSPEESDIDAVTN